MGRLEVQNKKKDFQSETIQEGLEVTACEERVLALIGALAVEGQASVEELGFNVSIIHLQGSYSKMS